MINWRKPVANFVDTHVRRTGIPGHIQFLNDFYRWPLERRRQVQAKRLSRLLVHAAHRVPYYHDVLVGSGIVRGNNVDLSRFRSVPELTRDRLRHGFESLKSDDLASRIWYKNSTGGSSGEPVTFLQDRDCDRIITATTEMHYILAGKIPGEPYVKLWGSDRDILRGTIGLRAKLSNFIRNQSLLNSFDMSIAHMQRYVETIQRVRPVMIEAYAESIYALARYVNASNRKLNGIRNVISSAGTLYPFIREEIERAFGCPTLNRYGSREVGNIAGERIAGAGLDVFTYTHLVEVVDEEGQPCGPGEEGDVLVTCLANFAMPMIRYRIGDRAVVGTAVSQPTPSVEKLKTVTGRTTDVFVRKDGSTVSSIFFIHFLGVVHNSGWLKKAQIIQKDFDHILIKMVTVMPPPHNALEEIRDSLRRVMGPACKIEFEFAEEIPPLPSGKYCYTMSLVPRP